MLFWFFISMFYINFTVATKQKSITDTERKDERNQRIPPQSRHQITRRGGRKEQENCKTVKTERAKSQR